jgi:hypothetical protein
MLKSLVIAAALAATALPTFAASVTVNISGLDAKAAHAKIEKAAVDACRVAMNEESSVAQYYDRSACITETVAATEAKLAQSNQTLAKL